MALAIYGKHPAKGDFLESGLGALRPALESWLDAVMAEVRHSLADQWEPVWHSALPVRFWLGELIWGEPVAGVLCASVDKVGRRFPMLILGSGIDCPPAPVVDPDQSWHNHLDRYLHDLLALENPGAPSSLLSGLSVPQPAAQPTGVADFWAVRPGPVAADLWADVALTDHQRATRGRSYWWQEANTADAAVASHPWSQVWAGDGLPSGHVLAWFFRGYRENV